ncbi:amino acid permease [Virgibacillus salexigens]|uniref:amino acid permease n=1 Tax=Virgibacillus salexigens TaxID=61016 RepID=UPI00190C7461|nr:amino acid permease [Virgibacillus salexigens]
MNKGQMKWWQLSLLGIGCTIGTGFFLGSSIAIQSGGNAVLIAFLLAAIGTYIVYDALAKLSVNDPDKGSFRSYAKKAFGRWAGFSNGWIYCLSEVLIMGSQLIALGIFTQFWFPELPLWMLAAIYGGLGLLVLLAGMQGFEKIENGFGIVKLAAILIFIFLSIILLIRGLNGNSSGTMPYLMDGQHFFTQGITGIWQALLYAVYAFGGIEVMGLVVIDLKDPRTAPKAGKVMLILLTVIYLISIALVLALVPWTMVNPDESPFITALELYQLPLIIDLFTGILIVAGFSTMVAALYAVITLVTSLAEDKDAPAILAKQGKFKVPMPAFLFTAAVLFFSIIIALLLPEKIFEYMTTAAGLMLIYNWLFILAAFTKLENTSSWEKGKVLLGALLIVITVAGTTMQQTSRLGFYVSLLFLAIIGTVAKVNDKRNRSTI